MNGAYTYATGDCKAELMPTLRQSIVRYHARRLFQKATSVFKFGLPEGWSYSYFINCLYENGWIAILYTKKFGIIPQWCTLGGYNIYYEPSVARISHPLLETGKEYVIGKDCEIIRLQPDWKSIVPIVEYHAELLCALNETLITNVMNSKLSFVATAGDKATAETLRRMFSEISQGELAVVVDKTLTKNDGSMPWQLVLQNVGQNYIADRIFDNIQTVYKMFDTEIGIDSASTEKKERLITSEVESNKQETRASTDIWLDTLKETIENVKNLYPDCNITVEYRQKEKENGQDDNNTEHADSGSGRE